MKRIRAAGAALVDQHDVPLLAQVARVVTAVACDPLPRAAGELEDRVGLLVRPEGWQDDDVQADLPPVLGFAVLPDGIGGAQHILFGARHPARMGLDLDRLDRTGGGRRSELRPLGLLPARGVHGPSAYKLELEAFRAFLAGIRLQGFDPLFIAVHPGEPAPVLDPFSFQAVLAGRHAAALLIPHIGSLDRAGEADGRLARSSIQTERAHGEAPLRVLQGAEGEVQGRKRVGHGPGGDRNSHRLGRTARRDDLDADGFPVRQRLDGAEERPPPAWINFPDLRAPGGQAGTAHLEDLQNAGVVAPPLRQELHAAPAHEEELVARAAAVHEAGGVAIELPRFSPGGGGHSREEQGQGEDGGGSDRLFMHRETPRVGSAVYYGSYLGLFHFVTVEAGRGAPRAAHSMSAKNVATRDLGLPIGILLGYLSWKTTVATMTSKLPASRANP